MDTGKGPPEGCLRVTQVRSAIGRPRAEVSTLRDLGLGRPGRVRDVRDTPSARGRIGKIHYMLRVEYPSGVAGPARDATVQGQG